MLNFHETKKKILLQKPVGRKNTNNITFPTSDNQDKLKILLFFNRTLRTLNTSCRWSSYTSHWKRGSQEKWIKTHQNWVTVFQYQYFKALNYAAENTNCHTQVDCQAQPCTYYVRGKWYEEYRIICHA